MNNEIKKATGLLVIEVVNSNPNGDPNRESDPRQRYDGLGEISPVSFKRKLRDLLEDEQNVFCKNLPNKFADNLDRYRILESRNRDRATVMNEMTTLTDGTSAKKTGKAKKNSKKGSNEEAAESKSVTLFNEPDFLNSQFVYKYWDARVFGNTFLEDVLDKNFVKTGIVQFGMGISIAPIDIERHTNTGKASVQEDKSCSMAPLAYRIVSHGVYVMPFFVNTNYAHKTGCTADDIELLKLLIPYAYDLNRSAIRPDVRIRHAWYVEHKHPNGSCPDYKITDALTPVKKGDPLSPSKSWNDYEDKIFLPESVLEMVDSVTDLMNETAIYETVPCA